MSADYEVYRRDLNQRIIAAEGETKKALIEERKARLQMYLEDVQAFAKAESEKKKAARETIVAAATENGARIKEQAQSAYASARGEGINADSMARVGGFAGGERPMLAAVDRAAKQADIMIRYQREIAENTAKQRGELAALEG
jgi:hypothetical protein